MNTLFEQFGISEMPWVMRVYVLLFVLCLALIFAPGLSIFNFPDGKAEEIISFGQDSLKIVLGAIIGSLSMAANDQWGKGKNTDAPHIGADK